MTRLGRKRRSGSPKRPRNPWHRCDCTLLDPVEAQVGWLREIGFEQADCYLKWWELAVFGGVKPTGRAPGIDPKRTEEP